MVVLKSAEVIGGDSLVLFILLHVWEQKKNDGSGRVWICNTNMQRLLGNAWSPGFAVIIGGCGNAMGLSKRRGSLGAYLSSHMIPGHFLVSLKVTALICYILLPPCYWPICWDQTVLWSHEPKSILLLVPSAKYFCNSDAKENYCWVLAEFWSGVPTRKVGITTKGSNICHTYTVPW